MTIDRRKMYLAEEVVNLSCECMRSVDRAETARAAGSKAGYALHMLTAKVLLALARAYLQQLRA